MLRLERAHLGVDAEQRGEKVLQVRPERNQQLGFALAVQRVGVRARRDQAGREGRVRRAQMRDEQPVDARRAVDRVQVGEGQAVRELEGADGVG